MELGVKNLAVLVALATLPGCRSADKPTDNGAAPTPSKAGDVSKQDAEAGTVKGFIGGAAMKAPGGLKPLSEGGVSAEVNNDDYALPVDTAQPTTSTDCVKAQAGNVHASGSALWISVNVDVTTCVNTGATSAKYQAATLSLTLLMRCPGVDLSKYEGTPYAQVGAQMCQGAPTIEGLLNAQISGPYTATSSQGQLTATVTFDTTTSTDDGSPCKKSWNGDALTVAPCTFLTSTIWTGIKDTSPSPAQNLNTFKLRKQNGLTGIRGHHFYATGTYQLQIGNWTGQLAYSPTADVPPTWSMASGASTASGTWAGATGTTTGTTVATGTGTAGLSLAEPEGAALSLAPDGWPF